MNANDIRARIAAFGEIEKKSAEFRRRWQTARVSMQPAAAEFCAAFISAARAADVITESESALIENHALISANIISHLAVFGGKNDLPAALSNTPESAINHVTERLFGIFGNCGVCVSRIAALSDTPHIIHDGVPLFIIEKGAFESAEFFYCGKSPRCADCAAREYLS